MKKIIIFIALIAFSTLISFSQTKTKKVDIIWGPEEKDSRAITLDDIVGFDENGFYALKSKSQGMYAASPTYYLDQYNSKMQPLNAVEFDRHPNNKTLTDFVIQLEGELFLFTSVINIKTKRYTLFQQKINKKTLFPGREKTKIAEINYSAYSYTDLRRFHYSLSDDSSKVLIWNQLPALRRETEQFQLYVFDSKLNKLWEKKIDIPYKSILFDIEDYEIDNFGNVHLLGLIYKEKRKEKRHGEPNYKYQILSYYDKATTLKEYPIKIPGKFLTDMKIGVNDEKDIVCGGFYSNEGSFSIIGCYFLKIDEDTKEIKTKSFKEFGIEFLTQNMSERKENKEKKKAEEGKQTELYKYNLNYLIFRDDGGIALIGEQFYEKSSSSSSEYTNFYYYYNDIVVISINPEGEIDWAEKIAKRQKTINDGGYYSSYALAVVKDKLYFVFNDHPKNLYYNGTGKPALFNKGNETVIVLVEISFDGTQNREALFTTQDADILTCPKVCEQISENEMIIFGQRKKTHRFARITFKN